MNFRIATLVFLCAACASPPAGERFVHLQSESYRCGAAEGLGCGLALAPVLKSIDALDGVSESSVSWDGTSFRIALRPGADADRVARDATALLEGEATCVADPRRAAAAGEPDRWFNAEETVQLSRHEADVIAAAHAADITAEVALADDEAARLQTVLREEIAHAFEQAHAAGGGVHRLWEQLPAAWPKFEARLAEFLTPEQTAQVSAVLARSMHQR